MFPFVRVFVLLVCQFLVLAERTPCAELTGRVQQTLPGGFPVAPIPASISTGAAGGSKSPLLQGGVKDSATLQPSLNLRPTANTTLAPLGGAVQGTSVGRGVTDYSGRPGVSSPSISDNQYTNRSGILPPISSYGLAPRTITASFPPQCASGVTTWVSGYSQPSFVNSGNGVWTKPGYEYSVLKVEFSNLYDGSGGGGSGGLVWNRDASSIKRVESAIAPSSANGVTVWQPGYEVCVSSNNGVTTMPGYEVSVNVPGSNKQTLGGVWTVPGSTGLRADRQVLDRVQVEPLSATPLLLPQIRATAIDTKLTRDGWYRRVAKAIYSRWENSEVGAGIARIRITVKPDRQLTGQVIDFVPLQEGDRKVDSETVFRETALRSVNNVNVFEVPPFPTGTTADALRFDVELKRKVDGPSGVTVAATNDSDDDDEGEGLPGTSACAK
jgi:hypothetical protein